MKMGIVSLFRSRVLWLFIIASVFFGGTFVGVRAGLPDFPPILFVALRYDIATIALFTYVLLKYPINDVIPKNKNDIFSILIAGVIAIGAANGFLFIGQIEVTSAVAAIIFSLIPVFSPILASFLLEDESLSIEGIIGTIVSLFGVTMVIGITPSTLLNSLSMSTLLVLTGAFCTSFGSVAIRKSSDYTSINSTIRTAWALPVSALMLHYISFSIGESFSTISWNYTSLTSLIYVGIFAGAIAYVAYFELLDEIGAIKSSIVFYISPVVATIGGWLLLGEPLSPTSAVGFSIIFIGFLILGWKTISSTITHYLNNRKESNFNFHL